MLAIAIALLVLGIALGFVFPVMFVAAVAGLVLLILFLVSGRKRVATDDGTAPDRLP